jgi:hypothetical protein
MLDILKNNMSGPQETMQLLINMKHNYESNIEFNR